DTTFKQLTPNDANRRTLTCSSGSNMTLIRVKLDRNGIPTDGLVSSAGIYLIGVTGLYMEDVEVTGNGLGLGLVLVNCSNFEVVRPYVHDMQWSMATDPGQEQMVGMWCVGCTDGLIDRPRIKNLTSYLPWL